MLHADSELHSAVVHRPIGSAVSDAGCGRETRGENGLHDRTERKQLDKR